MYGIPARIRRSNGLHFVLAGGMNVPTLHRECYRSLIVKNCKISCFCRAEERDFQFLSGPVNVSVDLKYDVLCL